MIQMLFCPKCGGLLKTKSVDTNILNYCSCGFEKTSESRDFIKEIVDIKDEIVSVPEINPLANEIHVCPKCGCDKAFLVGSQIAVRETWNSGETDRPSFICGKCGYKDFL
jgi:DNA-directed RNA polymerase subunit M/transcription elongation factor TFIIS